MCSPVSLTGVVGCGVEKTIRMARLSAITTVEKLVVLYISSCDAMNFDRIHMHFALHMEFTMHLLVRVNMTVSTAISQCQARMR